jgi:hypothetical protein
MGSREYKAQWNRSVQVSSKPLVAPYSWLQLVDELMMMMKGPAGQTSTVSCNPSVEEGGVTAAVPGDTSAASASDAEGYDEASASTASTWNAAPGAPDIIERAASQDQQLGEGKQGHQGVEAAWGPWLALQLLLTVRERLPLRKKQSSACMGRLLQLMDMTDAILPSAAAIAKGGGGSGAALAAGAGETPRGGLDAAVTADGSADRNARVVGEADYVKVLDGSLRDSVAFMALAALQQDVRDNGVSHDDDAENGGGWSPEDDALAVLCPQLYTSGQ